MLRELVEFGERSPYIGTESWTTFCDQKLTVWIHLDGAGNPVPPYVSDPGASEWVPTLRRSGVKAPPALGADNVKYALGAYQHPQHKTKVEVQSGSSHRAAFLALLDRYLADHPGDTYIAPIRIFCSSPPPATVVDAFNGTPKAVTKTVVFVVDGLRYEQVEPVRDWWHQWQSARGEHLLFEADEPVVGQCLVCGNERPLLKTTPKPIKHLPKGSPMGMALVSFNLGASSSYGLQQNANAPMCTDCGLLHAEAINHMLRQRYTASPPDSTCTSFRLGNIVTIAWTDADDAEMDVFDLGMVDASKVRELLASPLSGQPAAGVDESQYFMAVLQSNVARVVVREWAQMPLATAQARIRAWFEAQQLDGAFEKEQFLSVGRLLGGLRPPRLTSEWQPPSQWGEWLVEAAYHGRPIPRPLLSIAVAGFARFVRDADVPPSQQERLIRLIKVIMHTHNQPQPVGLNPDHPSTAYQCGRLLALCDQIQYAALPDVKMTLARRFYSMASTRPATAFSSIIGRSRTHLQRVKREKPAYAVNLDKRFDEIMAKIDAFPVLMQPSDQALFALGFYHQRAASFAAAKMSIAVQPDTTRESADAPSSEPPTLRAQTSETPTSDTPTLPDALRPQVDPRSPQYTD